MATDRDIIKKRRAEVAAQIEELMRRLEVYDELLAALGGHDDSLRPPPLRIGDSGRRIEVQSETGEPRNLTVAVRMVLYDHPGDWMGVGKIARLVVDKFPQYRNKRGLSTLVSNALVRSREKNRPWLEAEQKGRNWQYRSGEAK